MARALGSGQEARLADSIPRRFVKTPTRRVDAVFQKRHLNRTSVTAVTTGCDLCHGDDARCLSKQPGFAAERGLDDG